MPTSSIVLSFGFLASALWATLLALNVYLVVVRKTPVVTIRNAEWVYHLVAWGVPFLVAGIPLVFHPQSTRKDPFYGDARLWCWITSDWSEYRLWFFYIPIWIAFLITLGVYAIVCIQVCQSFPLSSDVPELASNRHSMQARNRLSTKTALYLTAFFLSYSGASINRVASVFLGTEEFSLYVLHALTIPSIGTFSALAYFGHRLLGNCPCRSRRKELPYQQGDITAAQGTANDFSSDWDARSMTGHTELAVSVGVQACPSITYYGSSEQEPPLPKHVPRAIGLVFNLNQRYLRQRRVDCDRKYMANKIEAAKLCRLRVWGNIKYCQAPFPLGYSIGRPQQR
ncbi:hypothetical protein BCR44DRAFT_1070305 [Catenaria anguillulae PL171]|uniref:G-protein coupled receptors family 2 profile 2 domain-containing protein n=1 Tax=Catenaria anguillulae PL171 TaxID=765915 RepID=A0A1Y2H4T4_9FUNG|nr:hypothetical protein BCR44DRAFT_1070305 [Catenaria anguillulae PL171]